MALNEQEIQALEGAFDYLKENKQVLDPNAWHNKTITSNYAISALPIVWGLLNAFGVKIEITADQATYLLEAALFFLPIIHNYVLAATHHNVTLNPLKNKIIRKASDTSDIDIEQPK